eukprot:CAMPEP_0180396124 /NCGR_PEP_ID=MMETSP0989-20121125/35271_1 /TAXON_ID=697907 /ORGANISM="non described non described, Strain CCMP2293" /LENGTH=33 /DNA_ID= /DNA_START= /DNA_END= /DNA_ORIENTATION=
MTCNPGVSCPGEELREEEELVALVEVAGEPPQA